MFYERCRTQNLINNLKHKRFFRKIFQLNIYPWQMFVVGPAAGPFWQITL